MNVYDKDSSDDSTDSEQGDRLSRIESSIAKQLQMLVELQANRVPGSSGKGGLLSATGVAQAAVSQLLQVHLC